MIKVVDFFKNIVLDVVAMFKGFIYGFVMFALFIAICTAIIYGFLMIKNFIF